MNSAPKERCAPRGTRPVRVNPFPMFEGEPRIEGPMRRSKMGRRRALVLGAVHVLIALHVVHWWQTGRSVSPVEPSESMRTLELGELNAGFLFFVVALVSTAIFGRFFCGWGCHIVALQDLCGWLMKKLGIRPRPFRSRLLLYAPLALALYMFVWPTFRRVLLVPALERLAPAAAGWFGPVAPFPGFSNHLTTEHFWETFPTIWVAIPFFLICGFLIVYLLGAKGFCTYGCPYGGFFAPLDGVAPGRIRVTDACEHCGHCTAVCTSNVRVHEEVRAYGMVVDPGCMKCMDCVSTCPNDALYFGFGKPASGTPPADRAPRRVYDLGAREEIVWGGVFLFAFVAFRGLYDTVPVLMAMGMAACATFVLWKGTQLVRQPSVRLQRTAFKRAGKLAPAGFAFAVAAVVVALGLVDSALVQYQRARAEHWDQRVTVSAAAAFAPGGVALPVDVAAAAERAANHYRAADVIGEGGLGLLPTREVITRRAWLALVRGDLDAVDHHLGRTIARGDGARAARVDRARVHLLQGRAEVAIDELHALVAEDPTDMVVHRAYAEALEQVGRTDRAIAAWIVVVNVTDDASARARLVELLERAGRDAEARRYR